jgi:hypothetical protein
MTNKEIVRFFNNAPQHIQGNSNLREPQVEGRLLGILHHGLDGDLVMLRKQTTKGGTP